jgi:hypothetical protein
MKGELFDRFKEEDRLDRNCKFPRLNKAWDDRWELEKRPPSQSFDGIFALLPNKRGRFISETKTYIPILLV